MIVPLPPKTTLTRLMDDYPWTVTIAFLNLLFFWLLFAPQPGQVPEKNEFSTAFIESAGRYYLEWQKASQFGRQPVELQALGAQAVREAAFLKTLDTWKSHVDPVGWQSWKTELQQIYKDEQKKPMNIFGLSQAQERPLTWITYQFSHQSATHLFSNLLLLVLFSACVEKLVGGFLMGVIYIMGGIVGGYFFMIMDSSGFIPMVGASASVTALMGFLATGSTRKNIPYLFFFSPFKGFYGRIFLSPYWILSLFLIEDLGQVLADPPGWGGGVAHSAHLGGAFAGLVLGFAYKLGSQRGSEQSDIFDRSESSS